MSEIIDRSINKTADVVGGALAIYLVGRTVLDTIQERKEQNALELVNQAENEAYIEDAVRTALHLREQALESGKPDDKITALEASNRADSLNEGHGLGMDTLEAFIEQYQNVPGLAGIACVDPVELVRDHKLQAWTSPEFARRHFAIEEALGFKTGVTLIKPQSYEEYLAAAKQVNSLYGAESSACRAESDGDYHEIFDFSVPGTYFSMDAAQALAWDGAR